MLKPEPDQRTLAQWLEYQQGLHAQTIELGLTRVREVADRLGLADIETLRVVVAGTNGKGSSIAMLEAIYLASGYRVGCYTSPHLHDYCERVRVNGVAVSESAFCDVFAAIEQIRGTVPLTYFEYGTLAALQILRSHNLDILLLEVGLGGRLDAVNVVDCDLALITQIDIDHRDWLGNTREEIGAEKAGIMRAGRPVVCADRNRPASVGLYARKVGAIEFRLGDQFNFYDDPAEPDWLMQVDGAELRLPRPALIGSWQTENAAAVVQVVELLQSYLPVSLEKIADGLRAVVLPGRFECRSGPPTMVLDVAHNPQACRALANELKKIKPVGKRIAVVGMLADKDCAACLEPLLGLVDGWYLASLNESRGALASHLQEVLEGLNCLAPMVLCDSVPQALQLAGASARSGDQLVVFGSFHTVAAAR